MMNRMNGCLTVLSAFLVVGICLPASAATVGYWRFEDTTSDGNTTDTAGTAGTMKAFGTPARSATVPVDPVPVTSAANTQSSALDGINDAFAANGGNLFADRFSDASDVGAGNFTLELYVNMSSVNSSTTTLFGKSTAFGGSSQDNGYWLGVNSETSGTEYSLSFFTRTQSNPTAVAKTTNINFNEWHHVAAVREDDNMTIYLDGLPLDTTPTSTLSADFRSRVPYTIGGALTASQSFGSFAGAGLIDEVRVSDVALDPSDFLSPPIALPTDFEWNINALGNWSTGGNWTTSFGPPDGNTHSATFASVITVPVTVVTDSAVTVKNITFGDTNATSAQQSYNIAGNSQTGSVTLASDTSLSTINVLEGSHEFQVIVNLGNDTTVNLDTNTTSLAFNNALNLNGNTLTKTGPGTMNINNDLNTGGGAAFASAGVLGGGGTIGGNLTVNGTGTVAPGSSAGTLTVDGNYSQTAGSLAIEIDGSAAGQFDVLKVTGDLTVSGGDLKVAFNALPGKFQILDFNASLSGGIAFDGDVNNTGAVQNVSFDVSELASDGNLIVLSIKPGDMNGDLLANLGDAALFIEALINRSAYNANGFFADTDLNGDLNGDLSFDLGDLGLFSGLLGGPASASAVPEPVSSSLLTMALGMLALADRRRRGNR